MMDINGLDYNTLREKLVMPEYGREIQRMVDYAITIEDREERQVCAETIITTMQRMSPQVGNKEDRLHKLWDHLAIMSAFKLDVDYPFDIVEAQNLHNAPEPLPYSTQDIPVRHYGSILFKTFEKLKTMPEGEERDKLTELTANQMKLALTQWSHGSADNEKVADDLARYTDGVIQLDLDTFRFAKTPAYNPNTDKRKKKK